ncbi:MAG: T9SS type A sorting domain-containing protein [Bacteroidetes bacterium]|nr:MAG: T9SS type A sorting domain-containing protein [Bacteroidota bacterium]
MKKVLLIIIVVFASTAWSFSQTYSGGSGTIGDPYQIGNKNDLNYLCENTGEWGKHFIQTADIVFAAEDFQIGGDFYNGGDAYHSIGGRGTGLSFTGTYDGDNHSISNIVLNGGSSSNVGLFGQIEGSGTRLKDLSVYNFKCDMVSQYFGVLVGWVGSNVVIDNVHSSGTLEALGGSYVGGLVGILNSNAQLLNSSSSCHINQAVSFVGGLAGDSENNSFIENCYATGNIKGVNHIGGCVGQHGGTISKSYATGNVSELDEINYCQPLGGLCGSVHSAASVFSCYATGNVTGDDAIGGLVGENWGSINYAFSTGSANGQTNVGGMVGVDNGGSTTASYWDTQTSGNATSAGGTGKTTSEMTTMSTFTTDLWDFVGETTNGTDDIWSMGPACLGAYPVLTYSVGWLLPSVLSSTPSSNCGTGTVDLEAIPSRGTIHWYTLSSGGSSIASGTSYTTPSISNTTSYFAEAVDGACASASRNEVVATIVEVPNFIAASPVYRCGEGSITLSATPTAGVIKWYEVSSGGSAIVDDANYNLSGNDVTINNLTTTTTYYAEAVDGSCIGPRYPVIAELVNCEVKLHPSSCGKVLSSLSELLQVAGINAASNYRYEIRKASDNSFVALSIRGSGQTSFRLSWISGSPFQPGTTYNVRVAPYVNGNWEAYGESCTITTPPPTLNAQSCGKVLSEMGEAVHSEVVDGATRYRFHVSNEAAGFSKISVCALGQNFFRMSWFSSGIQDALVYTVRVSAEVNGEWGPYGEACTITTPVVQTELATASCNASIPNLYTALYSNPVSGATNYRYLVTGPGFNKLSVRNSADNLFRIGWITGVQLNTTYTVRVAAYKNGIWGEYGNSCTVNTPAALSIQDPEALITSGHKLTEISLEVFPNPSEGNLIIRSSHTAQLRLVNELGQLIHVVEVSEFSEFKNELSDLSSGVYYLSGVIEGQPITKKVVVL